MPRTRRELMSAVLLLAVGIALLYPWVGPAGGQDLDLAGTPQAKCGPGSDPEGEIQGRVPAEDYENGRVDRPYTCNTELVAHHTSSGGLKVHRYVDAEGQECAFYDSTLLFPSDFVNQNTSGSGVIVLNMADPANPVQTTTLTTPAMLTPHESLELNQARGLLAAVTGTAATYPGVVDVYDVSQDCTQPTLAASAPVGFFGHESGFAPDGMTFYTAATAFDSIVAVDLTDPTTPTPVAFLPSGSHGVQVSDDGNRLYTTPIGASRGVRILDVSAVQAREPLAQAETVSFLDWPEISIPQTAIPVTIDGTPYLVEIDEFVPSSGAANPQAATPGAARIIDISDEANPFVVSKMRLDVHDPAIRQSDAGLENDPGNSQGARAFTQGYAGHYCAVPQRDEPGIVACSFIASGLRVFDIRDPHNPVEVAYFNNVTSVDSPTSTGGAWAMSAPAFVPERNEIWYSDANSGFYAVRLTNGAWPQAATVDRLAGPTRIETAVAASVDGFGEGGAAAAVLARADDFADALAGGPLAVAVDGPLLLSASDGLSAATAAELDRVLPDGATVHLLGGTAALSDAVAADVADLGFTVERHGGANRFETATEVAGALGNPTDVVVADGTSFVDAVVAAPVAAAEGGALLLSNGTAPAEATEAYLAGHPSAIVTAVGSAAATALGEGADTVIDGSASGDLSVDVSEARFGDAAVVGIARDDVFADALTGGAVLGRLDGPVLLVGSDALPDAVATHLRDRAGSLDRAVVFGGEAAVSDAVLDAIRAALTD